MTDAPERIFLARRVGEAGLTLMPEGHVMSMGYAGPAFPYIRADLVPQWQPIENAPKDGTILDVWVIRKHAHGAQDERRLTNISWGALADSCSGEVYMGWRGMADLYAEITPTHWMPLPKPPATSGGET